MRKSAHSSCATRLGPLLVAGAAVLGVPVPVSSVTPVAGWHLVADLVGSDTMAGDGFGNSVAISGTTVVVTSNGHDHGTGSAYVFTKSASGWHQSAELLPLHGHAGDNFGSAVASSSNMFVVGARGDLNIAGQAYVFTKTTSGWRQTADLRDANPNLGDGPDGMGDSFGTSVAVSGTNVVVGAPGPRVAYTLTKSASGAYKQAKLPYTPGTLASDFGASVAISGNTAVVGDYGWDYDAGRVDVDTKTASGWHPVPGIVDPGINPANPGMTGGGDSFGTSVAVSGNTVGVCAETSAGVGRGYIFTKTFSGWQKDLVVIGECFQVGVSGGTAAFLVTDSTNHAHVYVYTKTAAGWHQAADILGPVADRSDFATSVAVSGSTVVVGAVGQAYVYQD